MIAASIIVPSYNRPEQLRGCLEALVGQIGPAYEIIVVDDGSAQPLAPVCDLFGEKLRCIRQENAGPAAARNTGAAAARGRFLAFTDDDCRPRPDWLQKLHHAHGGDASCLVGGRVENGLPGDIYASVSQELCDYLYEYFGAAEGSMPFFTSNNLGCDKAEFERLGGFDQTFPLAAGEDRDFGMRWGDTTGALKYAPDAVIDHYHSMNFGKFWRQHSNYGAGAQHLHKLLDRRGILRPKREPLSFYLGLVLWPLRQHGLKGLAYSVLMGLTQVAMINGYYRSSRQGTHPV
ncbi:glycosyltransferase [Roseobacter sp. YSTF-M11]|uniref:Glycosyltransferase n=1 Tax=Roseobacter insulae TaxID=2859783 RepID=A0A9X1FXL8_9RHOB|nr:glycosyltransferase [Roseobacter insulae]MBW4708910.1 glycosyltransferase [Roseobacter insulae]